MALIIGSTEGIGYEDALALSSAGWSVIMMGHNLYQRELSQCLRLKVPESKVSFEKIDLADLSSIKAFASRMILKGMPSISLINNAAGLNDTTKTT